MDLNLINGEAKMFDSRSFYTDCETGETQYIDRTIEAVLSLDDVLTGTLSSIELAGVLSDSEVLSGSIIVSELSGSLVSSRLTGKLECNE